VGPWNALGNCIMSVAFVFPGQGSQSPGMLHHLLNHRLDSDQGLDSDVDVQVALFAAGVATACALMEQDVRPAVYVANVNARALRTKELVAKDLANNIAHGVRWYDATTVLQELGCNLFLEMPPGHTLSDLARENLSGVNSVPVEAPVLPRVLRLAQEKDNA
jgi:malonyl CoA-acyl carrier protein transacylase